MGNKKKTATITFHAPHNYGSMLQAYALQHTLLGLDVDNEIINLRTDQQKSVYFNPNEKKGPLKYKVKKFLLKRVIPNYSEGIMRKYDLFESFLQDYLLLTPKYSSEKELHELAEKYDYYITGSDQCWNTSCIDFDWAYYLTFTGSKNKIAYASSFGPHTATIKFDEVKKLVGDFKKLSAREVGTANMLTEMIGAEIPVLSDPTLLVSAEDWSKIIGDSPLIDHPYIFLYSPYKKDKFNELAHKLSKSLNLPIVTSNITDAKGEILMKISGKGFEYHLGVGPKEFLNLIKHSQLVLSGSYHAILFSIIFQKPFFAYNGDKDNRMKHVLEVYGLENRSIDLHNYMTRLPQTFSICYDQAKNIIAQQKEKALSYLRNSLELD